MNKIQTISINGRSIGNGNPPYIIAEMSANHNGSIDTAIELIQCAKNAGADAIKIQTYRPETMTLDSDLSDFQITEGLWKGKTLYELYQWAQTPWEWHERLFSKAEELGITIFSSPFDNSAVDLLEDLNTPAYKIASFELVDLPLIQYVASTKKPMIMSTGMANELEIQEAIGTATDAGCTQIALLHCVSAYPAEASSYNLVTLSDMRKKFGVVTGLSDHTPDNATAIAAVAIGASIIEKHVTLDKSGDGPDDSFSINPKELTALVNNAGTAWEALGHVSYKRQPAEDENIKFRRSLYFVQDIQKGTVLTEQHIKSFRPGYGLAPKHYWSVLGSKLNKDVRIGDRVEWYAFEN